MHYFLDDLFPVIELAFGGLHQFGHQVHILLQGIKDHEHQVEQGKTLEDDLLVEQERQHRLGQKFKRQALAGIIARQMEPA